MVDITCSAESTYNQYRGLSIAYVLIANIGLFWTIPTETRTTEDKNTAMVRHLVIVAWIAALATAESVIPTTECGTIE